MSDYRLKTMMEKPERLAPGHRMCAGCGATIAVRSQFVTYFADFTKEIRQSSVMQPDVWKFLLLCIHTPHGRTVTYIMHLKMQVPH